MVATEKEVPRSHRFDLSAVLVRPGRNIYRHTRIKNRPLEAPEEMHLVSDNRATNGESQLLLRRVRLHQTLRGNEVVLRRHLMPLHEGKHGSMKLIRSRLRNSVEHAARSESELGVKLSGKKLELLHRFDRNPRLRASGATQVVIIVASAIKVVGHVRGVLAVNHDGVSCEGGSGPSRDHSRYQVEISSEVPVERWRIQQLWLLNVAADFLRSRVNQWSLSGNGNLFLDTAHRQLNGEIE